MYKLLIPAIFVCGVASAAPVNKAKLSFGKPTVSGALDAKALGTVVKRSSSKLLDCYKKALATAPALQGTATATFTIDADGKVATAAAAGLGEEVETCIAAAISKLKFAKPKDGEPVDVSYPLTYDPGYQTGAFASLTGTGDVSSGFDDTNIYGGLLGSETGEPSGGYGYGRSGFGPGGGGTGWGTIGTGRYGTIGHGTGSGYGGMRGRGDVPTVSIGQAGVTGDLDKAIVRRYVKRNIQKLVYCYEKQLLVTKGLAGTVTATFTIGADGSVTSSTASGLKNHDAESCMADVIKTIVFPKPHNGEVTVKYPMTFRPAAASK